MPRAPKRRLRRQKAEWGRPSEERDEPVTVRKMTDDDYLKYFGKSREAFEHKGDRDSD